MKPYFSVKTLILCFVCFLSCEKEDPIDLLEVSDDFTTTITTDSDSFIDGNNRFASDAILDITSNAVIAEHQNFIIDSRLHTLSYEITNFSGDSQTIITDAALIIGGTRIDIGDIEIENNLNIENYIVDRYLLNRIAYDLRNTITVNTLFSGELDDNSTTFDLIVRTNLTVGIDDLQ